MLVTVSGASDQPPSVAMTRRPFIRWSRDHAQGIGARAKSEPMSPEFLGDAVNRAQKADSSLLDFIPRNIQCDDDASPNP